MAMLSTILAVALSLTSPKDYVYTTPLCGTNQIVGIGMGENADYMIVRAEDVAFLREAYAERTDVHWAVIPDGTNAIDTLVLARPSMITNSLSQKSFVFSDQVWGGCFSLSYTTNEMPYCELSAYPGSFVRPDFRFSVDMVNFREVDDFPSYNWAEFRAISSNAVANGQAFATNDIPTSWFDEPYIVCTNYICKLYAGLPLFDVAACSLSTADMGVRRVTVYDVRTQSTSPSYTYTTVTNSSTGAIYSWPTSYNDFSTIANQYEQMSQGMWYAGFAESRSVQYANEYSCARDSGGDGPWPLVPLGIYESSRTIRTLAAVSNTYVWIESPVKTNFQDAVEVLQTVLTIDLTHNVGVYRAWSNPSLPNGDPERYRTEATNIVHRGVMCLPVTVTLDKSVLNWNGTRWLYKMNAPMAYIQDRATRVFGDASRYWPTPAQVTDDDIAATGTSNGRAYGATTVEVITSFNMHVYMVYRRIFNARVLSGQ